MTRVELIKEIINRLVVLVLLLGIILLLLGATGGFNIRGFSLVLSGQLWQWIVSLVGIVLIILGAIFAWKDVYGNSSPLISSKKSDINILDKWDVKKFQDRLSEAQELCMISVSNYHLLSELFDDLEKFIDKGGRIRCIYVKDSNDKSSALQMVAMRSVGVENDVNHLRSQYSQTIEAINKLADGAPSKENVTVKVVDYLHGTVITLVDRNLPTAVAYVTLNGFGHHFMARPSFIIEKEKSPELFKFHQEIFENMWNSPACEIVETN